MENFYLYKFLQNNQSISSIRKVQIINIEVNLKQLRIFYQVQNYDYFRSRFHQKRLWFYQLLLLALKYQLLKLKIKQRFRTEKRKGIVVINRIIFLLNLENQSQTLVRLIFTCKILHNNQIKKKKLTNHQNNTKQTLICQEKPMPLDNLSKQHHISKNISLKHLEKRKEPFEKQKQMMQSKQQEQEKLNQEFKYRYYMGHDECKAIAFMCTGMNGQDFELLARADLKLDLIKEVIKEQMK
ncbi:unnamed protein product [Paramecium octaurelia]|uniref:Uncharacterized protein n=1 Tax=Paramecium octaurelia TaxID=43137 RepID=A0A8S1YLZ4_PAROT|nr:unnamed protein product [Paramecium octaurelia]